MFPSINKPEWDLCLNEHGTTLRYQKQWYRTIRSSTESPSVHLEGELDNYKKGIRTFSRTLSQSLSTYLILKPLMERLHHSWNVSRCYSWSGCYARRSQVAILRSNIRRFAPPFNISQAFRLYYFQQKTTGFYTRGLMLLYLEADYFKNINSAWPRINFWIL
jgi:hypothetical protein